MYLGTWAAHHVPKITKIFVVKIRAHCFHDYIYIMPILLLWDLSTLCVVDHLLPQKIKTEKVHQGVRVWIVPTHQIKYLKWLKGRFHLNELFKINSFLFLLWRLTTQIKFCCSFTKFLWCYQVVLIWFLVEMR